MSPLYKVSRDDVCVHEPGAGREAENWNPGPGDNFNFSRYCEPCWNVFFIHLDFSCLGKFFFF